MVFEKKWSEEQNEKILELHGRIPNSEIAKQFNTTASNVSKRVSYLKGLKKKQEKKQTKSSKKSKRIDSVKAKSHSEADEFTKEYKKEFQPINEVPTEEISNNNDCEIETKENVLIENQKEEVSPKINWTGVSESLTMIADNRFKANNLAPLTQQEKDHLSATINQVLDIRAEFYFKYADLVNLGLAGFTILAPRIMDFLGRSKKKKEDNSKIVEFKEPTKELEIKKESSEDELQKARERYNEAMKNAQ